MCHIAINVFINCYFVAYINICCFINRLAEGPFSNSWSHYKPVFDVPNDCHWIMAFCLNVRWPPPPSWFSSELCTILFTPDDTHSRVAICTQKLNFSWSCQLEKLCPWLESKMATDALLFFLEKMVISVTMIQFSSEFCHCEKLWVNVLRSYGSLPKSKMAAATMFIFWADGEFDHHFAVIFCTYIPDLS